RDLSMRRIALLLHCSLLRRALHSCPTRRSSDLTEEGQGEAPLPDQAVPGRSEPSQEGTAEAPGETTAADQTQTAAMCWCGCASTDRKSTRLNSSHVSISYAVFCLQKNETRDDEN